MSDVFNTALADANALIGDAAVPYALIETADRSVGGIVFDVTVREVHSDESVITVNPTQSGTPTSDNVFDQPSIIEIVAGSSDSTAGFPGYARQVYEDLLALRATKQVFNVYTGKRAYASMLFGNIMVTTDETSEFTLMVTCRLQQVLMTDVSGTGMTAATQADPASTAPETNVGNQTLQPATNVPSFNDYLGSFAPVG